MSIFDKKKLLKRVDFCQKQQYVASLFGCCTQSRSDWTVACDDDNDVRCQYHTSKQKQNGVNVFKQISNRVLRI